MTMAARQARYLLLTNHTCLQLMASTQLRVSSTTTEGASTTTEGATKTTEGATKTTEGDSTTTVIPQTQQAVDSESSMQDSIQTSEKKIGGFAKAFARYTAPAAPPKPPPPIKEEPFLTLLRKSKFVDLGDPENKIVLGTVYHIVGDDLYIDFGGKFPVVCTRPIKNAELFVRGTKVRLRLKALELSTRFLGCERDLTILEGDALLIGLISSPCRRQ